MDNFDIVFADVFGIQTSYGIYNDQLNNACTQLMERIEILSSEDTTFTGKGATAIKAYFSEVHHPIAQAIGALSQLLAQEYSERFFDKLRAEPVAESADNGRLNAADIQRKIDKLRSVDSGVISEAEQSLSGARNAIPRDAYVYIPTLSTWRNEIGLAANDTVRLKSAIANVDSEAASAFSSKSSAIASLKAEIANAISFCTQPNFSMSNYVSGAYDSSALANATNLCIAEIEQGYESYIESCEAAAMLEEAHVQRELAEAQAAEAGWATFNAIASTAGMIAGAVGVVVGVAACVTPVGAAAFAVVGLVGLGFSAYEAGSRMQTAADKNNALNGRKGSGFQATDVSKGRTVTDIAQSVIEDADSGDLKKSPRATARKTGSRVGVKVAADLAPMDEETAQLAGVASNTIDACDGLSDFLDKSKGTIGKFSGATAIVGVASDVAVGYGDDRMAEAQKTIQKDSKRLDSLNNWSSSRGSTQNMAWAR